jgi:sulfotransferase
MFDPRKRKYHFVAGLPRSGSTVLCNILAQNPRFRSDGVTSGLLDLLVSVRDNWEQVLAFKNWDVPETRKRVMREMFFSFFADSDHPVVFDKSRGWVAHIEMIETLLGSEVKILVPVRDMQAIIASWEKLWRKNKDLAPSNIPLASVQTVEERAKFWSSPTEPTGWAYLAIKDAIQRGFESRMLFIEFERLAHSPEHQMKRIYDFLGEDYFRHDFENIEQRNLEKDPMPWMKDLHKIRRKLEPLTSDWQRVLGPATENLAEANRLWMNRV